MFLRLDPSTVQRALTSNRYLVSSSSAILLGSMRPVYRTMKLPLRISLVANRPRPVLARPARNGRREVDVVFGLEAVSELEVLELEVVFALEVLEREVLGMSVAIRPLLRTSTRASSALAC